MKKALIALAISLALVMSIEAQVKNGPIVDKVVFSVVMDRQIGIQNTIAGKTDVFWENLGGKDYKAISAADLDKLSTYFAPGTQWEITFNPYPNVAPYQVKMKDGKVLFNPFAIREVRYAMNWLIDRQKIVDEIMLGMGTPMITGMTPGQPGTYKYNLVPAKLGMTNRGNEKKAIDDITAAMTARMWTSPAASTCTALSTAFCCSATRLARPCGFLWIFASHKACAGFWHAAHNAKTPAVAGVYRYKICY